VFDPGVEIYSGTAGCVGEKKESGRSITVKVEDLKKKGGEEDVNQ
jgi:hypothetical protein